MFIFKLIYSHYFRAAVALLIFTCFFLCVCLISVSVLTFIAEASSLQVIRIASVSLALIIVTAVAILLFRNRKAFRKQCRRRNSKFFFENKLNTFPHDC